jgi:hypothetical protein
MHTFYDVTFCSKYRIQLVGSLGHSLRPVTLAGPILYQIIWNITYALSQIKINSMLSPEALESRIDHAEELVSYGDGFEMLQRNKTVLVKTGRGDDVDALTVAKRVLEKGCFGQGEDNHCQPQWRCISE